MAIDLNDTQTLDVGGFVYNVTLTKYKDILVLKGWWIEKIILTKTIIAIKVLEEFEVYQYDELTSTILTQIFACILLHIPIPNPNNGYPVAFGAGGTSFLGKILCTLNLNMRCRPQAASCKSKLWRSLMSLEMDTNSSQNGCLVHWQVVHWQMWALHTICNHFTP